MMALRPHKKVVNFVALVFLSVRSTLLLVWSRMFCWMVRYSYIQM